jgi:hypothetical protein
MSQADVERMHARNVQVGRSHFHVRGCVAKSAAIAKGRRCVKQSEGESTRMRASCSAAPCHRYLRFCPLLSSPGHRWRP